MPRGLGRGSGGLPGGGGGGNDDAAGERAAPEPAAAPCPPAAAPSLPPPKRALADDALLVPPEAVGGGGTRPLACLARRFANVLTPGGARLAASTVGRPHATRDAAAAASTHATWRRSAATPVPMPMAMPRRSGACGPERSRVLVPAVEARRAAGGNAALAAPARDPAADSMACKVCLGVDARILPFSTVLNGRAQPHVTGAHVSAKGVWFHRLGAGRTLGVARQRASLRGSEAWRAWLPPPGRHAVTTTRGRGPGPAMARTRGASGGAELSRLTRTCCQCAALGRHGERTGSLSSICWCGCLY